MGRKQTKHKPWLSIETLKRIEERRAKMDTLSKCKTQAKIAHRDYKVVTKEVRKRDKRIYIKDLAKQVKEAVGKNKELYLTTKKQASKFREKNT